MTTGQEKAYKLANQNRRERLLRLYHGTKPGPLGWIPNPGFIQRGKHADPQFRLPFLSGTQIGQTHLA